MVRNAFRSFAAPAGLAALLLLPGCASHKYQNPITKDTQQPDKVLFDTAVDDITHGRYERARLTIQTLMNTYDTSEYLAKAKLALADSWYREGGAHGMAEAEQEYKDFILFYPTMEEAAEAQGKICKMQFQQMDKADRDPLHAQRAEEECKQLLQQFPNSPLAPEAQQMLRSIQEVLADGEFRVGTFYHKKGGRGYYSSAARLQALSDHFKLFSEADEALWLLADDYARMGDKFENQQVEAYTKIVRDYPLSPRVPEAAAKLKELGRPVPEADPVAYARMKYDQENRPKRSLLSKAWGPFGQHPDVTLAARSGTPPMEGLRPMIPESVPPIAAGRSALGTNEVTVSTPEDPSVLDKKPDARTTPPAADGSAPSNTVTGTVVAPGPPTVLTRSGMNINTASEADLAKLPGVGKTMAKRIVAGRPFTSISDLRRTGISEKVLTGLRPPAAAPAAPAAPQK